MTLNRLALVLVCTAYFYLGSIPEERKLLQEFGADYARYQQTVPRLIPRPGRTWSDKQAL
jgi:protein-S-isoprenylcysteine O-methyltransferase Ste14